MDNNELALALKEEELDKVAVYLSRCGLQVMFIFRKYNHVHMGAIKVHLRE